MSNYLIFNSLIENIDNFFSKLFENLKEAVSWTTLFTLLMGILIGLVIASTVYAVVLFSSLRKKEKEVKNDIAHVEDSVIYEIVDSIKKQYVEETEGLSVNARFGILKKRLTQLVNNIANVYYPESKYPLYELTIEELIMFMQYLSTRIDVLFEKPILRSFKKISISQVIKVVDAKKKMDENKAVKILKKTKAKTIGSVVLGALRFANPVYWIQKLLISSSTSFAMRKISLLVIDVVADETNKTYSKSIFQKENNLDKLEIDETLKSLERDDTDE